MVPSGMIAGQRVRVPYSGPWEYGIAREARRVDVLAPGPVRTFIPTNLGVLTKEAARRGASWYRKILAGIGERPVVSQPPLSGATSVRCPTREVLAIGPTPCRGDPSCVRMTGWDGDRTGHRCLDAPLRMTMGHGMPICSDLFAVSAVLESRFAAISDSRVITTDPVCAASAAFVGRRQAPHHHMWCLPGISRNKCGMPCPYHVAWLP
jgi:hypothetical protein